MTTAINTTKLEQAYPLSDLPPPLAMLRFLGGFRVARILYAVAELGIADMLASGAKTPSELAQATKTHESSLYRVLRSLASVGIFAEDETGKFHLTSAAEALCTESKESLKASVRLFGQDWHWETWGELLYSIKTGEPAFKYLYEVELFEFFQQPQIGNLAQESKTSISYRATRSLLDHYDFSSIGCLIQLGYFSGVNATLVPLLKANPKMKCVLLDFHAAIENDSQFLNVAGMAERCKLVEGNCIQSVPIGGDIYLLLFLIHNWNDEDAIKILQNCHQRMTRGGKLLLVEAIMPTGNEPFVGKLIDIQSLLTTPGGYERTEMQYRQLLYQSGFEIRRIIPSQTSISIIEAVTAIN